MSYPQGGHGIYISAFGEFVLPLEVRLRMLRDPGYVDRWCQWQYEKTMFKLVGA